MLKLREDGLFTAGSSLQSPFAGFHLGTHIENDGANMERSVEIIIVATNPTPAETIGIGTKTYTFVASITGVDQIIVGLSAEETAYNIAQRINLDKTDAGCTAYILGDATRIALVSESVTVDPVFTPDGAKIVVDIAWEKLIAEATLENINYYKVDPTSDVNAKPIVLVERNPGTYQNFLY